MIFSQFSDVYYLYKFHLHLIFAFIVVSMGGVEEWYLVVPMNFIKKFIAKKKLKLCKFL